MKQSKEQVIKIAIKVMNDIEWPYETNKDIRPSFTSINEQVDRWKNLDGFEKVKDKIYAYWTVILDFPEEERWEGRNVYFVDIMDENCEPFKVGHRQAKFGLEKNERGIYCLIKFNWS